MHRRIISPLEAEQDNEQRLAFQHTVFCKTSLPYRDPGDAVRLWKRTQGMAMLVIQAGQIRNLASVTAGQSMGDTWIVVLGHERCGAVSAAVAGGKAPGRIADVLKAIEPAVEQTKVHAGRSDR